MPEREERQSALEAVHRLLDMAAGRAPADLAVEGAHVVDVFTGTVREDTVRVGCGRFVGFGPGPARQRLDARGRFLLPGLIDAHIHLESSLATPVRFAALAVPRGTTAVVADPHEIANVLGLEGIRYILENAACSPLNVFVALPSCVPATPFEDAGAALSTEDLQTLIDDPRVSSIGEVMHFPGVVAGDNAVLEKILLGVSRNKPVDGHAPGLMGRELDAYLITGIGNTHECSEIKEMQAWLERGAYVFLREGSAARNLAALLPAVTPANARRCAFCSDDRHAADMLREGHMDHILRSAVRLGLDPVQAVTMCTLNAAEACGLRSKGAVAPGRDADFLLVDDLTSFRVRQVYIAGKPAAEDGRLLQEVADVGTVPRMSVHVAPLDEHAFEVAVPSGRARVIGLEPRSLVTRALTRNVRTDAHGLFTARDNPGLVKLAVVERHRATGRIGVGILQGYGLRAGAVATTIAHDSHNIVIAGTNDADMRLAVDELARVGGGITVCRDGAVLETLALPVAGLITGADPRRVAEDLERMIRLAREMGTASDVEPFMALSFMALPVIPELKLTNRGLFDVRTFSFVPVDAG